MDLSHLKKISLNHNAKCLINFELSINFSFSCFFFSIFLKSMNYHDFHHKKSTFPKFHLLEILANEKILILFWNIIKNESYMYDNNFQLISEFFLMQLKLNHYKIMINFSFVQFFVNWYISLNFEVKKCWKQNKQI